MENVFKRDIARHLIQAVEAAYKDRFEDIAAFFKVEPEKLEDFLYGKIERPRDHKMGDFAFPAFFLAGVLKEKPPVIAANIAEKLEVSGYSITGPYINFTVTVPDLAKEVLPGIHREGNAYGSQKVGQEKNIVIDFSSPNIAKPFGVGHLRSTALGNSLYRLYHKLGYNTIGINHLGDWGTQFGKMIVAFQKWGDEAELKKKPIDTLFDLYVRFHSEEEENPALGDEARTAFKGLEEGDKEATALWNLFKEYSLEEFQRIYDTLGVRFDHYTGESFYNDKTEPAVNRLKEAGLAVESEGALVVKLDDFDMTPCLLKKADGATLYATRDLAGIFFRHEQFHFDKAIYVVGSAQREHFKQVFKVVELLGEDYADRLVHVEFGWIRFKDQAMSTRKGNIVFLDDVINTAVEKATQIIKSKNPNLPDLDKTARTVALGAIIFADLGVKKHKDVNFSWEEVLNFEGETGPYLQYTHARLSALLRKFGGSVKPDVDFDQYESFEEKELLLQLYRFGQVVESAAKKYEPSMMAEYLLELAAVFNRFYQRKDAEGRLIKIISDDEKATRARMLLIAAVQTVLKEGLYLLGIEAPEEM
ncbi:MAG: arginine--tRNA ligase [FCB group bacterium]|nr:arginine--tRNA ligase [FCB group bacterium]